jgi:GTPase involved in cell partitioning and DNA repair
VLVHLVDVSSGSGRDPVQDFDVINEELRLFDPPLIEKRTSSPGEQDRCTGMIRSGSRP